MLSQAKNENEVINHELDDTSHASTSDMFKHQKREVKTGTVDESMILDLNDNEQKSVDASKQNDSCQLEARRHSLEEDS